MANQDVYSYGILASNIVNLNSGANKVTGNVGSYNPITGSGTLTLSGAIYTGALISDVLSNANEIYSILLSYPPDISSNVVDIGGMTFNPGIIELTNTSVSIGGATPQITLDGIGTFLFQLPNGGLTTNPNSGPVFFNLINGAVPSEIYWMVNGDVNLQSIGNNITTFSGTIICSGNITMGTSSSNAGTMIAPSTSFPNGTITLNGNSIICRNSQINLENISNDYINIETNLADSQAIRINAANTNGGILINAGFGGIEIDTTNSISMNANAESNLSTTLGNVYIQSQPGLSNIDAGSGINIGCDNNLVKTTNSIITPIINIGTSSSTKTISIGNSTGSTSINLKSGSSGILIDPGTGKLNIIGNDSTSSSINLDASAGTNGINILTGSGGFTLNSGTGKTQIISNNTNIDAIRFDTGISGGIFLAAGSQGVNIGNDGISHPIVIGNTTGSSSVIMQSGNGGISINAPSGIPIYIGNNGGVGVNIGNSNSSTSVNINSGTGGISVDTVSGAAINIGNTAGVGVNIGNSSGTSSVNINSGTWGITIGNNSNSGEIQIGNSNTGKTITLGNNKTGSRLITRWEAGGWIKHQENPLTLSNADLNPVTLGNLLTGLLVGPNGSLSANRTLQIDSAINIINGLINVQDNDAIDFCIINTSSSSDFYYALTVGTGGNIIGDNIIRPITNSIIGGIGTYNTTNSSLFRLTINVSSSTYTVYRIA